MKLAIIFIAIAGIYMLESEGIIRKCFPVRFLNSNPPVPTTAAPVTQPPTTAAPVTQPPTTQKPTTTTITTKAPVTQPPTTAAPATQPPTTAAPVTAAPTTLPPVTQPPTTQAPSTAAPTTTTTTATTSTTTTTTKPTTTTTTIPTTTTTPGPPRPCALWTRYNNDDAPSVNGFAAGTSVISNTTIYVGKGMYQYQRLPARIQIVTSTVGTSPKTPGGYVAWDTEVQVPYVEYLVLPQGCSCSWMAIGQTTGRAVILTGDPTYGLAVGRKVFSDGRIALTKVVTFANSTIFNKQFYNPTSTTAVYNETATELLVCEATSSTAGPPKITFNTESCGMWSTIGTQFSAANAFVAGQSISSTATVNVTAYVGRGQKQTTYNVGRYQVESPAGTYVTPWGFSIVDYGSEWLIVPEGCQCKWMHPDKAKARKGLMTTPDQTHNFMVGLKRFSNGQVSVMHVNNVYGLATANVTWGWYEKADKTEGSEYAQEVLVCETLPTPPNACALWTRYLNDNGPLINGFSAGISYFSNTTAYVGRAMYSDRRMAARVQITTSTVGTSPKTAGGYVSGSGEVNVPYVEYLVVPDGCTCSWMIPSIASNRALIFTGETPNRMVVGRKTFSDGRVSITKAYTYAQFSFYMTQCYNPSPTTTEELCTEAATELLVCETSASTSGAPKVTFASESCGMWSTIGYANTAATNGIAAGPSILTTATLNSTSYVGRGQFLTLFVGGRYQVESPVGTYTSTGGTYVSVDYGSEFAIVPQGCTCRWMTPDQGRIRKGLMTIPDQKYNFMVGRKTFANGLVSISHVNNVYGNGATVPWQWYANINKTEGTDTATEVLVCETLPTPPNACALWTRYNFDDAPSVNGFSAGTSYLSNTTAYVGRGMYTDGTDYRRLPARIQTTASSVGTTPKTAGGYVSWTTEIQIPYPEYLVVPSGCSCSWMAPSIASNHPGLILTGEPSYNLAVGRKTFSDGRVGIAKVVTEVSYSAYMTQCYNPTSATQTCAEPATELLVCETTASTSAPPKITFNTEACGMWSTIGTQFSTANAFAAGQSISSTASANITAYVGRGQRLTSFIVGRYQAESPSGTYVTYLGFSIVDYGSEWLIVPEGCQCKWMHPDKAKARKGLMTSPDVSYNFMVGLKRFSNGQVSVMHVNNVYGIATANVTWGWYEKADKTEGSEYAQEVLVCETLPTPPNGCALWTRYNGDNGPSINGFSAGISYLSNTTAYVGMGILSGDRLTARIQITTSTVGSNPKTPGGYVSWVPETQVPYVEYLVVPDGCACSWMIPSIASNHPGLILTGDPVYGLAVGRKVFSDGRVGLTRVLTFAKLGGYMHQCYNPTSTTEDCTEAATELLVCESATWTTARPKVTFASESCGMWSTIGMVNSPNVNGFNVGLSIATTATVNITAYVGRGHKMGLFVAGRYQMESVTGTYVSTGGSEVFVDYGSEWLVVPQNCSCSWIAPATASTRKGLITVPDEVHDFLVGRHVFSNGIVSVSNVNFKKATVPLYYEWYNNLSKIENTDIAAEVLVCAAT